MDFFNAYAQGFARVAARVLPLHLAQPAANAAAVVADLRAMAGDGVALVAYPELNLTGCSCGDLFMQDVLLDAAETAVATIAAASAELAPVIIVGAPVRSGSRVYNCAVVIQGGVIWGLVPKSYPPTCRQSFERRWFAAGDDWAGQIEFAGQTVACGTHQMFEVAGVSGLTFTVEMCEDMGVPIPPRGAAVLAGANLVVNISGSPVTIGKADDRKLAAQATSAFANTAFLFTAAGPGESSTDLSWDGQTFVYESGELLGESVRFPVGPAGTTVDIDLARLRRERYRQGTQDDNRLAQRHQTGQPNPAGLGRWLTTRLEPGFTAPTGDIGLRRAVDRFPFVPLDPARLAQDCYEAFNIQVSALVQRLTAIGAPKLVIGVSGGLDSTQALLVCARAMDLLGRPRSDILAYTMPGFATSETTKSSALALMAAIGATAETIDIRPAANQLLRDLGHPFADGQPVYDVTFENVQAGLRTDYLFRIANQRGGIVVGTGDLSELALGWCTYGVGDHMAHYGVNAGLPKTLIPHLIGWVVSQGLIDQSANAVVERILGQDISPELIPSADGRGLQSTEAMIGPYGLHDFFLYHFLRRGAKPSRIAYLAWQAWHDRTIGRWPLDWAEGRKVDYDFATIRHWLETFIKRFFTNQFKRSAMPDGPKVIAGATLSPRGDWRMPTDAQPDTWLAELADLPEEV